MLSEKKDTLLVWVTNPYACERIVRVGKKMADELNKSLTVISIQKEVRDNWNKCGEDLEMLYEAAKSADAELTVIYSDNSIEAAVKTINELKPSAMVTGLPGSEGKSVFLECVCSMYEEIPVYAVDLSGNTVRIDLLGRSGNKICI